MGRSHLAMSVLCSLVTVGVFFTSCTHAWSGQALASSFTCTGIKWGEDERLGGNRCRDCRTCRFDNVCLNHSSLEIMFYKGSLDVLYYHEQTGKAMYSFPDDFVMLGHSSIGRRRYWGPAVVPGPLPAKAAFNTAPVAALASLNDLAGNFGHALFDFLFPVYNMLSLLGVYHPNFQLLLAQHQGGNPGVIANLVQPAAEDCRMLSLISQRHAFSLETFAAIEQQRNTNSNLTCFSTLVAGSAHLDASHQRLRFLPFRNTAFQNLGIVEQKRHKIPHVTMLKKHGKRLLENADDLTSQLKRKFKGAKFEIVEGKAIATMSLKEQLETMSRTDILITPCGGVGTVLMFLRPGATAIAMNYWNNVAEKSVQMESIYYWNLEYLNMQYLPVLPEDYELTTDRPGCEKSVNEKHYKTQGAFIHCNVYLKSLHRLEHAVQNALQHWAVRQDKQAVAAL